MLSLTDLGVKRRMGRVLSSVSLQISAGECAGLIGPNGAGKTTLLRAALGLIAFDGQSSLASLPPKARARMAAYLPQTRQIAWDMSVEHLIALGRLPHGARRSAADVEAIEAALNRLNLAPMRTRPAKALSGGEQARVLIARALAQQTPLLIADEPTAGLDPAAGLDCLHLFADLARAGRAVLATHHDLSLAARFCTRLIVLKQGRIVADGPPRDILSEKLLAEVFDLRARLIDTPDGPIIQALERIS